MSKHTRVPEVLIALTELTKAQPEVEPAAVITGGKQVNDYRDYIVFIGFHPISEEWVMSTRQAPRGLAANDSETVTVGMLIAAADGDDDMTNAIQRAREIVGAVERVVTGDSHLGLGNDVTATVGDMAWRPLHTDKGAECNVVFDITVKVLL
jgi:hypothetical protein